MSAKLAKRPRKALSPRLVQAEGFTEADLDALIAGADGKPVMLDLFGCQGGAATGYAQAGFFVICLDLDPQPRNPFPMIQADALWFLRTFAAWIKHNVAAVHASPPCQAYSNAQRIQKRDHPDLIGPVRALLRGIGLPFVIENVEGARDQMLDPVTLCGAHMHLTTYRHRLFEAGGGLVLRQPRHREHTAPLRKMGRPVREGEFYHAVGNFPGVGMVRKQWGVGHMDRDGVREAIPPIYARVIGHQIKRYLERMKESPMPLTQEAGFTEADLDALIADADGPVLVDFFCKAGGASMGYRRAGFFVIGVDIDPQKRYPFPFIRADALWFLDRFMDWVKGNARALAGSPPCKVHTRMKAFSAAHHLDLIPQARELFTASGLPYAIENVPGAGMIDPVTLCGSMFGLGVRRHRLFETNWPLEQPDCRHAEQEAASPMYPAKRYHSGVPVVVPSPVVSVFGRGQGLGKGEVNLWRSAMGIDWMVKDEMAQAIPPAYTKYIGDRLMKRLTAIPAQRKPSDSACTLYTLPTHQIGAPMAPRASTKTRPAAEEAAAAMKRAAETAAGMDPFAAPARGIIRTKGEVRRDRYGRYLAPTPPTEEAPEGGVKDIPYTRATTMAKAISDTFALEQWAGRMIVKGLTMRPDLRALAAATPLEDRDTLNKVAEDAKTAAGNKVSANLGTARHALTELYDRGHDLPPLEAEEERDLAAYKAILAAEGIEVLGDWIERSVFRPDYNAAGTLDRIVRMPDGSLRIADLKTGKDLSYGWAEIAIQLKIYQGAEWSYDYNTDTWERTPETDPNLGLVIHLPVGKGEATTYDINLDAGQVGLDLAHRVRAWRKMKNLAAPRQSAVAAAAEAPVEVAPATPFQRVMAATNKATLAALWDELNPQGLWTPEVHAAATAQLSKFATT